ncbi:hypothetical protein MIND_01327300 [Mycena indigotica]|uniref:RRM domain-containing protein n=1 Tax=Mycena indigotica TaxID=2126181 RepID=A0A8H6S168_9AGAR|nr:uncharacterized protein MIND_01327300 [Mycena indigotica]KAF7290141.1 hypothetical protein MIND_01327300 [Mycena indigotica]
MDYFHSAFGSVSALIMPSRHPSGSSSAARTVERKDSSGHSSLAKTKGAEVARPAERSGGALGMQTGDGSRHDGSLGRGSYRDAEQPSPARMEHSRREELHHLQNEVMQKQRRIDELERENRHLRDTVSDVGVRNTMVDLISMADVRRKMEDLEAEIYQLAAGLADSRVHPRKADFAAGRRDTDWLKYIRGVLGAEMANAVADPHQAPSDLVVQMALQAVIARWCFNRVNSWSFFSSSVEHNKLLTDLYGLAIQDVEDIRHIARWKTITHQALEAYDKAQPERQLGLRDFIANVLALVDPRFTVTVIDTLASARVAAVCTLAYNLHLMITAQIFSEALAITYQQPGSAFDPDTMENMWGGRTATRDVVVCTTNIGLTKRDWKGETPLTVVVKPKLEEHLIPPLAVAPRKAVPVKDALLDEKRGNGAEEQSAVTAIENDRSAYAIPPSSFPTTTTTSYPASFRWPTTLTRSRHPLPPHSSSFYQQPPSQTTPRSFVSPAQPQYGHTSATSQPFAPPASQPQQPQQQPASLLWTSLEPWMDHEYARQVCSLLGWDARVQVPPADGGSGTTANNAGYAVLTFSSVEAAQAALAKINATSGAGSIMTMPNSSRTFEMRWAPSGLTTLPSSSSTASSLSSPPSINQFSSTTASLPPISSTSYPNIVSPTSPLSPVSGEGPNQYGYNGYSSQVSAGAAYSTAAAAYPKEYSIFVGDLAPETSNSDLVAVFRNPVLGLRNDRAPKFIRPFTSCKSAKIMLDPVTGVSRGYGFVRFIDEADQQRALIEMHGLYCLSRPMRISPATAKFKPAGMPESSSLASIASVSATNAETVGVSASVSAPIAGYQIPPAPSALPTPPPSSHDAVSAEWKHHAHARAILGNMIGPNGEQLTSTDPYNTTVFVGGLSPLVGEDTLRTFFVPFGEIHYVKVPVGKHCGFVQFVRKADAEQAIEKMQGFPVGGSRIRLSWGRSQYKAAQAAAQAAQAAAMQASTAPPQPPVSQAEPPAPSPAGFTPQMLAEMTPEQIVMLLQKFGPQALFGNTSATSATSAPPPAAPASQSQPQISLNPYVSTTMTNPYPSPSTTTTSDPFRTYTASPNHSVNVTTNTSQTPYTEDSMKIRREDGPFSYSQRTAYEVTPPPASSSFSPFSPDPSQSTQQHQSSNGLYAPLPDMLATRRDSYSSGLKSYSGYYPSVGGGGSSPTRGGLGSGSPPTFQVNRYQDQMVASRQPISRPASGSAAVRNNVDDMYMHELNGTLANLDLGRGWQLKSPINDTRSNASADSASSGASVQFRMTPSPP